MDDHALLWRPRHLRRLFVTNPVGPVALGSLTSAGPQVAITPVLDDARLVQVDSPGFGMRP